MGFAICSLWYIKNLLIEHSGDRSITDRTLLSRPARRDYLVRRGLKISHLRIVAALAETGQIGAAAQRVNMTQPAASRLLAQLEEITDAALYTRHSRGVDLTEAGRLLADHAVRSLQGLDLSWDMITQAKLGTRGLVRIGSVTGPALDVILPVIRNLRVTHPEIEIEIQVETSAKLAEALLLEELDFYIGRIPDGADSRPFTFVEIGPEPISLIVRLDHPLMQSAAPKLEDCLQYDWVMQPPGGLLRQTTEHYLLALGHTLPRRVIGTTSTLFTLALIDETNAIAPLARAVGDFFIKRAALNSRLAQLPVAHDLAVKTYGMIQRNDSTPTPAAHHVMQSLSSRFFLNRTG